MSTDSENSTSSTSSTGSTTSTMSTSSTNSTDSNSGKVESNASDQSVSDTETGKIRKESGKDTSANAMSDENKAFLQKEGIEVVEYVAKGGFAEVYKAKWKNKIYAIKQIRFNDENKERQKEEIENERKIGNAMRHNNIIRSWLFFEFQDKYVFFLNDFADGGDLISILEDLTEKNENLEERLVRKWFLEVVEGIAYMEKMGYAHRDIKADNILMRRDNPKINQLVAKVTDFGFSQYVLDSKKNVIMVDNFLGTIEYSSPENILCKMEDRSQAKPFNPFVSDAYSLGCLLFVMASLRFPFKPKKRPETDPEFKNLYKKMMNKKWKKLKLLTKNEKLNDLLEKLLEPDVHKRLDTNKVKKHKWSKVKDETISVSSSESIID